MRFTLIPTLLSALFFCAIPCTGANLNADTIPEKERSNRVTFVKTGVDTTVYKILERGRPEKPGDSPVPYFAIHSQDNMFVMTIGGNVHPIFGCDIGNDLYYSSGAGISFLPSRIPIPTVSTKKADFYINPLTADIDFQIVGFGNTKHELSAFVKFGTNGVNNNLVIKRAFLKYRGFAAGMKTTLFQDELACPPTIDPQGPCGMVSVTSYELSYISPNFKGFRAAIGVDMPAHQASDGRYFGKDYKEWHGQDITEQIVCDPKAYNQMVPDIPLWLEWQHNSVNRIRLSGIIRTFNYQDMLAHKRRVCMGYGIMLSGNFSPWKPLVFYAQAVYGQGINNYIQDLQGIPLSYVPDDNHPGRMNSTKAMGLTFGFTYQFLPKWTLNSCWSTAHLFDVKSYALAESKVDPFADFHYTNYVSASISYNIFKFLGIGLEYLYGQRVTYGMGKGHDNRLQMQLSVTL